MPQDSAPRAGLQPAAASAPRAVVAFPMSRDPLIIFTLRTNRLPLGIGSVFYEQVGRMRACFLVSPTWSLEDAVSPGQIRAAAESARRRCPAHEFIFLCNTDQECERLVSLGERAITVNHNVFLSERIFRVLAEPRLEFDALYNARFAAWKRHELAREIPSVLYVAYHAFNTMPGDDDLERQRIERAVSLPGHHLLNRVGKDGLPIRLAPDEVNAALNRAAVGLCLSAVEGAMLASMEYMLAGLPVVSTPSRGGRDVFFDAEFCLVVEPNASSVAKGVAELRARQVPRDYIRARTLSKLETQRRRLLSLLDEILARQGSPCRFGDGWPFAQGPYVLRWQPFEEALSELRRLVPPEP